MHQRIIRHELVEITVPANSTLTRFQFPDLPNLRNVLLMGIKIYDSNQVAISINNQLPLVNQNNAISKNFITLVNYGGKEFLKQAPALMFNTSSFNNNASANVFETFAKTFVGQRVNYPKSYIQLSSSVGNVVDQTFLFSIFYSMPLAIEKAEDNFTFGNKG